MLLSVRRLIGGERVGRGWFDRSAVPARPHDDRGVAEHFGATVSVRHARHRLYGDFDIIWDHFSRNSQRNPARTRRVLSFY